MGETVKAAQASVAAQRLELVFIFKILFLFAPFFILCLCWIGRNIKAMSCIYNLTGTTSASIVRLNYQLHLHMER